ncbi:hypothetical protein AQ490_10630 [Wenjunlia vitaminophila]|uniref:Zinc finger CGNR domain-containing protein n=1 Tax=Wenjunlia vitaminophila TaxID=76728 RepID=A0A0T6LJV3_WENVI|nr:CGNR zinc finger domain-containing protein [Wenjunlia vitaminophila]KRV46371.1 hypothetical protein AQ490_10630 [Wenjunlia vitaminophila]
MPPAPADPRPLTGEPLAIDLLNTRWIDTEGFHDLLEDVQGLAVWLDSPPVRQALGGAGVRADAATLRPLLQTRAALDALVDQRPPYRADAVAGLNSVLDHGRIRHRLTPEGPATDVELDAPSWQPAWAAAVDFLRLLAERPERIRPCANPNCVLHFYDVSKNGNRRWCSMAGCGNRAKASRHYARRSQG